MQSLTISENYCALNKKLHVDNPRYGLSGGRHVQMVMQIAHQLRSIDILDYGCGKSKLAHNLPFKIKQYDPAIDKFSAMPKPAEIVICTDVLEHIEPECLDNVLKHLHELTQTCGYFAIATRPAKKTLADGRNAHLIIEPVNWWLQKLLQYFAIADLNEKEGEFSVLVKPKIIN